MSWMDVDASRVWVVPLAVRSPILVAEPELRKEAVKARYGLHRPYLLYVGNIEPRKNLSRLLQAFRLQDPPGIDLVLAGRRAWLCEEVLREAGHPQSAGRVHVLDYVGEEDLPALYQSALAFVYPSLMEGFGLPVLEAMASGTAVVVSKVEPQASLVEDAGWLVCPEKLEDWRQAISEVTSQDDRRAGFAAAGKRKAARFSWDQVAQDTARCYEQALSTAGRVGSSAGTKR
jgi:glycosyltransferase involved in cell wall biosynthesis